MEEKITTKEEYQQCLKQKKKYRDDLFNLKLDIFMTKNDPNKTHLLEEKHKILKIKYTKLMFRLEEYELNEEKKEGMKK